ncbi:MAG: M56 family metallopeptidase [Bacteroidaceae bacterium]|nr:M56 family metallopeptidase [Bacteroidaceae bacterium]
MYIPFLLMLRNESFFRFNRVVLLVIVILSLVLPLCDVHFLSLNLFTAEAQENVMVDVDIPVYVVDGVAVDEVAEALPEDEGFFSSVNWWAVAGWIYLIGMVVTILVKLVQLAMLYRTIHRGVLWTERKDGVRIYCHAGDITPFSWFNTIVISENDYEENAQVIIRHEMGHIVNYHSLDIILVNICEVIQWCNPLSWILVGSLRDVHEYEADDAVLASGVDAHRYQLLLIKKAVGSSSYAFANSFNHSLLKKRITMMINKKSNPWMRTKALYIIPVALIALSAFATPEFVAPIEEAVAESTPAVDAVSEMMNAVAAPAVAENKDVVMEESASANGVVILLDGKEVSSFEELANEIKKPEDAVANVYGCDVREELRSMNILKVNRLKTAEDAARLLKVSLRNINLPKLPKLPKLKKDEDGRLLNVSSKKGVVIIMTSEASKQGKEVADSSDINLSVVKDGASIIKMASSIGEGGEPAIFVDKVRCKDISSIAPDAVDHINVIKSAEAIKEIYGDKEEYKNGVVEIFTKDGTNKQEQKPVPVSSSNKVFDVVDVIPSFPGGDKAMWEFFDKERVYPESCLREKKQGRVLVSFIVEKDGSLSNLKVIRSVNSEFDKEAIRLVKSMPKWTPAIKDGKYVRCKYTMPVTFKLPS